MNNSLIYRTVKGILLVQSWEVVHYIPQIGDFVDLEDGDHYKVVSIEVAPQSKSVYVVLTEI